MSISKELFEKAKNAKTAAELAEIAKAENIDLSAEEAEAYFVRLNCEGELSDEELDNVSGGGCTDPVYKYAEGDCVIVERYIQDNKQYTERRSFVVGGHSYGKGGKLYWGVDTSEPYEHAGFFESWIVGKGQVPRPQNKAQ